MKVLAVAGDAGGARTLEPVIRALAQRSDVRVECRPYKLAVDIWRRAGIDVLPLEDDLGDASCVLLATSVGAPIRELEVIEHARKLGKRTLAVLDHWLNYRARFTVDGRLILPDAIAVMDERARDGMIVEGFPRERVIITGHPVLEGLALATPQVRRDAHRKLGEALGLDGEARVLWAAQPFFSRSTTPSETHFGSQVPRQVGFGPDDAFRQFAARLARNAAERRTVVRLLFKAHPRDVEHALPPIPPSEWVTVHRVPHGFPPREAALGSDVVAGMQSMLLVESCLLGVPVVSFQPGLRLPNPLPTDYASWSHAAYDDAELDRALAAVLGERTERDSLMPNAAIHRGATRRIIELLVQPT